MSRVRLLAEAVSRAELVTRMGTVRKMHGLAIEAEGPRSHVGELCAIVPAGRRPVALSGTAAARRGLRAGEPEDGTVLAEVVAIQPGIVTLMPHGSTAGLGVGSTVVALGDDSDVRVGEALVGRVIDGFGRPLDGGAVPVAPRRRSLRGTPLNPMHRPRIRRVLETGVRTIDALLTVGQGQRMGIFAGSGVGKSTLLGMIARHVRADVNVIALIGERGREVREFVEKHLGPDGLRRSVVVSATADQPALGRIRAAHAALAIAEDFRDAGRHVLLTMDSITRLAMARREVGLAAGEPPTARGYTPSVFAELPQLCERCGTAPSGGSITALLTVLVEGDDLNEPVSDALRAILDGHVVLSRHLVHQGQYPAIDVLKSASRVLPDVTTPGDRGLVRLAIQTIALLERNRQMVELGAYEKGTNPALDAALQRQPRLDAWLRQSEGGTERSGALRELAEILDGIDAPQPPDGGGAAGEPVAPRALPGDGSAGRRGRTGAAATARTDGGAR